MEEKENIPEDLNQDNINNFFDKLDKSLDKTNESFKKIEENSKQGFLKINEKLDFILKTLKEKRLGLTDEKKN